MTVKSENKSKIHVDVSGVWIGLVAYLLLICLVSFIIIFG